MKKLTMLSITALTAFTMTGVTAVPTMAAMFRTGYAPVSGTVYNGSNSSCDLSGNGNCSIGSLLGGGSQNNCQIGGGSFGGVQIFGGNSCQSNPCGGSICGDYSCGSLGFMNVLPILPLTLEELEQDWVLPDINQKPDNNGNQNRPDQDTNKPDTKPDTKPDNKPDTNPDKGDSFAQEVLNLVNEERAKAGAAPLVMDDRAQSAANVRAEEIQTSFSHTRPDGSSYSTALSQAGVSYRASGENIAYGQNSAQAVMQGWMNSSGHRANILNSSYTSIGIGHSTNSQGVDYWTQLFFN